ncbi:MAG: hypothetical protein WCJ89_06235, partial [Actinomycetes bacterium]
MLVLVSLLFLVLGTAMLAPLRLLMHQKNIDSSQILAGLLLLISFVSILAWIGLIQNTFIIGLVGLLFITSFGFELYTCRKEFKTRFSHGAKLTFYVAVAISIFLDVIGYRKFATLVNPDPYGFMALSGGFNRYGSIHAIMEKWSEFTGQTFVQGMSWDEPTKLLPSSWLVPDMGIRYAVDELASGKRIGLSALLTPAMQIFDPIGSFLLCWLALAIVFIAIMTGTLLDIAKFEQLKHKETLRELEKAKVPPYKKPKYNVHSKSPPARAQNLFLYLVISGISISSVWILVFLFEGLTSQLCAGAAIVAAFAISISIQRKKLRDSFFNILALLIIVTGIYFVYVQQLPILILASVAPFFIEFFKLKTLKLWQKMTVLVGVIVSAFALVRFTSLKTFVDLIVGSSSHGSIHLGSVNLVFGQFSWLTTFWNSINTLPRQEGLLFNNFLQQGLSISSTQNGYILFNSSFLEQVFSILGIYLLISIYTLYNRSKRDSHGLTSIYFVLSLWSAVLFYYLISHVYLVYKSLIRNPSNQGTVANSIFSDYVWLRLIAIYSILLIIALAIVLGQQEVHFNFRRSYFFAGILLFVFSSFAFARVSIAYQESSTPGSVASSCGELKNFVEPIYIYQPIKASQAALALTLCPQTLSSFSDSFPSKLKADGKRHDAVDLLFNSESNSWYLKRLGTFTMTEDIQTPCNYA